MDKQPPWKFDKGKLLSYVSERFDSGLLIISDGWGTVRLLNGAAQVDELDEDIDLARTLGGRPSTDEEINAELVVIARYPYG